MLIAWIRLDIAKMFEQWDYADYIVINRNVVNHVEHIFTKINLKQIKK